jgi:formiminotetrahydrofolate cyclodeaminase
MQAALRGAVEPPLQTMQTASRLLDLAAELMVIGNKSAISDVGAAAAAARSGFDGALLNVEINLASIEDATWVQDVRSTVAGFPPTAERADAISRHVLTVIRS